MNDTNYIQNFSLRGVSIAVIILSLVLPPSSQAVPVPVEPFTADELYKENFLKQLEDLPEGKRRKIPAGLRATFALIQEGDYGGAISSAQEVLKLDPQNSMAYELIGTALSKQGKVGEALDALKKAEKIDPNSAPLLTTIASLYAASHSMLQAKEYYNKALKINDQDTFANWGLGLILTEQYENESAVVHLKKAYTGRPEYDTGISIILGTVYNRLGQFDEALSLMAGIDSERSLHPGVMIVKGNAYLGKNQLDKAIGIFSELAAREKGSERSHLLLGVAYKLDYRYDEAIRELQAAIRQNPQNSIGHYHLGDAYRQKGRIDQAIGEMEMALRFDPDLLEAMRELSNAYIQTGEFDKAIKIGERLLTKIPEDATAHFVVASTYHQANQTSKAITHYRETINRNPKHIPALNNLALLLSQEREHLDEALDFAIQAIRLTKDIEGLQDPFLGELNDTIGWIYIKKGRYQEGLDYLLVASRKSPQNPSIYYHLGVTFHNLNRNKEAVDMLEKALKLSIDFTEAKDAEILLKQLHP